ncbi:hypothetical protein JXD38_00015 [candidate division WOR-3 bacterium]|nr:hypothetical protein [candidate division WOR-3 bacterium]
MVWSSVLLLLLTHANQQLLPFERYHPPVRDLHPYVLVGTGLQYNVPVPIVIRQTGQPDIRLTARFSTRPFSEVPYYDIKVGLTRKRWACELELIHHKLYLDNRPPEVDMLEITHGYNPILVNVVHEVHGVGLRGGAGILLAHPESTIRGQRFPETGGILGWYVSGPAGQISVSKWLDVSSQLFAGFEVKVAGAWARVPVVDGSADVPNLSLHGLASVGWRF